LARTLNRTRCVCAGVFERTAGRQRRRRAGARLGSTRLRYRVRKRYRRAAYKRLVAVGRRRRQDGAYRFCNYRKGNAEATDAKRGRRAHAAYAKLSLFASHA